MLLTETEDLLQDKFANDLRYELLLPISFSLVVKLFDQSGLLDQSLAVLEHRVDQSNDPTVRKQIVQRLWESNDHGTVVERS